MRGADLPPAGELKAAAKAAGAPRQALRFLDAMALPAFVAGVAALDAAGVTDGERCGLFTVGGWDPQQHQPELGEAGDDAGYTEVARHYITTALPTDWLRKMLNNVLCQLSMTRNLPAPTTTSWAGPARWRRRWPSGGGRSPRAPPTTCWSWPSTPPRATSPTTRCRATPAPSCSGWRPQAAPAGPPADGNGNGRGPDGAGAIGEPCGPAASTGRSTPSKR